MIYEKLTEEECYLYALITDESGIDLAEFCFIDESQEDGCFRAWPFQVPWFRNQAQKHIDAASRSCGKSLSIKLRAFAFPFNYPGEEMVITAPEAVHLQAVTDNVEGLFTRNKLAREMLQGQIKHRPYHMNFVNGSRIMGRIPQRDGTGVQGSLVAGTLILTRDRGLIPVEQVTTDDYVWSHEKRWSEVCSTYELPEQTRYRVKGQGAFELSVNADHRFYTRNDISSMPGKKKRKLGEFTWEYANDLRSSKYQAINSYWTGATDFGQPLGVPIIDFSKADTSFTLDEDFWWITGRYIADGSSNRGCVDIFAHPKDHDEITDRLDRMGATYSIKEREHSSADRIRITNMPYGKWLRKYFKHHSTTKELPTWCLTMPAQWRSALLDGYLSGDGSDNPHGNQVRRASTSVSKKLTLGMGLLAGSLGYNIGFGHNDNVKTTHICGTELKNPARDKYLLRLNRQGEGVFDRDGFSSYKIRSVVEDGTAKFYGISVADGSYLADGVFHHNTHPLILEQDEASSYPEAGWTEIKETVKIQNPRARWRCHGVSFGIGGTFNQNISGKNSTWTVTRLPAMYRPNWTEKERRDKIEEYGGYDSSGYRRNILGLPADAGSPMFVAHRLMAVTDSNLDSEYNTIDYYNRTIDEAQIRDLISGNIEDLIKIPVLHGRYKKTWIGMDLGWTESPSSIVVFAEDKHPKKQETVLKLITRLLLRKVSPEDQVKAIIYLMNLYRPMAYALDATGAGFPLIDNLRAQVRQNDELSYMLGRIKDCQFSTKVIVGFDPDIEIDEYDPEGYLKAAIMRPFIEASTDAIRLLVDSGNIILPYDRELIDELQATPGTTKQIGNTLDAYGRSSRKQGMHNLDAMRMALFTWQTHFIDEMIESHKQIWTPPAMITY